MRRTGMAAHLGLGLAIGLGLLGCSRPAAPAKSGGDPSPARGRGLPVPVLVAVAAQRDVPLVLSAIGTVRAFASVSIKARVDGQLAKVAFQQGDEVKAGDLIFLVDPRPFQVALSQAQAVLARDQASLQNAEVDMRRTDELADTKAVSASAVDANRAKVASLRATVEADRAAIETAQLQLSYASITAPIGGRMGLRLVDQGNMVKNNETILALVNQTRPIYVDFAVPEQSLMRVREAAAGKRLSIEAAVPQSAGPAALGELEVVNNQVDNTTGTILLRGLFANPDERLWPGQFVAVTLTLGQLTNAVVVPSQAVQNSQSGEFVYVVTAESAVEKRLVKLGPAHRGELVIEEGVRAGEIVVTDGQLRLVPGAKVDPKAAPSPAPAAGAAGRPA